MTASSRSSEQHAQWRSGYFLGRISNQNAIGHKASELDMTSYSRSSQCDAIAFYQRRGQSYEVA
jgi:hypothetical protein